MELLFAELAGVSQRLVLTVIVGLLDGLKGQIRVLFSSAGQPLGWIEWIPTTTDLRCQNRSSARTGTPEHGRRYGEQPVGCNGKRGENQRVLAGVNFGFVIPL